VVHFDPTFHYLLRQDSSDLITPALERDWGLALLAAELLNETVLFLFLQKFDFRGFHQLLDLFILKVLLNLIEIFCEFLGLGFIL
jgi:hypothetical protein